MDFSYHIVDVFTTTPLEGNALAVFPNAIGLDARTMQRIAREMSLSETTFVFPAETRDGAARVRIFTPNFEMMFAGHPTIGTAHVLRELQIVPPSAGTFVLEENVGPISVRVDAGENPLLWLNTPPIETLATFPREQCAAALSLDEQDLLAGIPCELLSAGNPNLFVPLRDAASVDRAVLDNAQFNRLVAGRSEPTCFFIFAPTAQGAYSRMFAPQHGVAEDPATGSATGPLAAFMMKHNLARREDGTRLVSEQGTKMGRRSLLHVLVRGTAGCDGIEVGGAVTHVASGSLHLPNERAGADRVGSGPATNSGG
jgi:trans-2,3-dihydro-3-hydroxyanthranilate isomerase